MEDSSESDSNSTNDWNLSTGSSYYYYSDASDTYEYDEDSKIEKEITQDQKTISGQKVDKKYESTLNIAGTSQPDISCAEQLRTNKKKKIQETKTEPGKEYKCRKCARSYKHRSSLYTHKKLECDVTPQFICKFCDKRFKRKFNMNTHIVHVHQVTISNQKKEKIQESKQKHNCDKCSKSYSSLSNLKHHERLKHTADNREFICDGCGYKTRAKSDLSGHISRRHLKNTKTSEVRRHNCEKCYRTYTYSHSLTRHKRLKHATVMT